jgi:valyl-tRNA synthetase
MTEKRQTSQGYIIRILQHFATKLWNITNFVMLFQVLPPFAIDRAACIN